MQNTFTEKTARTSIMSLGDKGSALEHIEGEDAAKNEVAVGDPMPNEVLETRYAGKCSVRPPSVGEIIPLAYGESALGRWQVVKVFWKAMLFCVILNWAALNDGVRPSFLRLFAEHDAQS